MSKKIIIFGAGNWGKLALEYYGADAVDFFCDNNPERIGQEYCGKKIISFDRLKEIHADYRIVTAINNFFPIANQLRDNGIENENYVSWMPLKKQNNVIRTKIQINKNKMLINYNGNKKLLNEYPYIFGQIPEFENLEDKVLNLDDEIPYFFEDLSKPLLICNISHPLHIKFLFDNVRASEDVAMDNHIYLYYESKQNILEMLCQCDLKPLLKKKKFVFLFGEKNKCIYPIDFKEKYGIDYNVMKIKPLRVNELKRIIMYHNYAHSGQDFLFQISAPNEDILPFYVPQLYSYLPRLENKTCNIEFDMDNFLETKFCPDKFPFFPPALSVESLYSIKNIRIFSVALYNQRRTNTRSRISPTVFLDPHLSREKIWHDIYKSFPYRNILGSVRNPISRHASIVKDHNRYINDFGADILNHFKESLFTGLYFSNFWACGYTWEVEINKFRCIKLESLKSNPVKGTKALCKYFQVPFDENMLHPEKFPYIATGRSVTGKTVMGFDPTPKRDNSKFLSDFDLQRLVCLFEPVLKYYGYEYEKYAPVEEKDLRDFFSKPFLYEKELKITDRDFFTNMMLYLYNFAKKGEYKLPPLIEID